MISRRGFLQSAAAVAAPGQPDPAREIFRRVNELRAARGAAALAWAEDLARCAREQSGRKAALRFAGHDDPERGGVAERLTAAGLRWMTCGENVFQMLGYEEIADFAIVFWWYSLGHQRNMVSEEFTETGVGINRAPDGTWFATQIFMRRRVT